jgi:hypothetical protein
MLYLITLLPNNLNNLAGEHENRTHLTVLTHGDSGFEVRDGHQLRNLSLVSSVPGT